MAKRKAGGNQGQVGGVLEHQLGKSGVWVGWGPLPQYRHEVRQLLGNQVSEFSRGQRLLSALHRVLMEVLDESLDGSLYITEFLGILKIGNTGHVRRTCPPCRTLLRSLGKSPG